MTKKKQEIPGNATLNAALFARELERLGAAALNVEFQLRRLEEEGLVIGALRFVYKTGVHGEVFCVVTARTENSAVVAFHHGDTFAETMKGLVARLANGSLKWKEDEYAR